MKYAVGNRVQVDPTHLKHVIQEVKKSATRKETEAKKRGILDIIKTPKLRKRSLIMFFNWYVRRYDTVLSCGARIRAWQKLIVSNPLRNWNDEETRQACSQTAYLSPKAMFISSRLLYDQMNLAQTLSLIHKRFANYTVIPLIRSRSGAMF